MISRTTTRVSAAHGQCARGRHGRTGIESVIEWWLVQLLMGPDARATHRREREEESVSSNGTEKNVRTERTSRERKEEGARKKGLSPKKSARARARSLVAVAPMHNRWMHSSVVPRTIRWQRRTEEPRDCSLASPGPDFSSLLSFPPACPTIARETSKA